MSSMSMKSDTTVDRRAQIQTLLNEQGVVNSQELAERFEVSLMTIYRDLDYLQEQGVAKRQHGGAVSADRFISPLKRSLRESQNVDAKRLIGRWAAEHLINQIDDSLIVDSGTTTLEFVRALPDVPINVMVNSLDALSILAIHKNTNVYALGGELRLAPSGGRGAAAVGIDEPGEGVGAGRPAAGAPGEPGDGEGEKAASQDGCERFPRSHGLPASLHECGPDHSRGATFPGGTGGRSR